jgi:DUF1680 family protein
VKHGQETFQALSAIPSSMVTVNDKFWKPRLENNRLVSLFCQYKHLVKSGVLDNFKNASMRIKTGVDFHGLFFADSDAYKWLEAVSFSIMTHPDSRLEVLADELIGMIAAAQEDNGYINTYMQLIEPDKKFTNLGVCHELYTAGHLIQAAVIHHQASDKTIFLNIACRLADHLVEVFGPGKFEAVDGHAGVEMSLVGLYRETRVRRYLDLARFFINQRGACNSRLRWELQHLDQIAGKLGKPGQNNLKHYGSYEKYDGRYAQDHLPVREQTEVVGHAVRAMYLYCGMVDVAIETKDATLISVLERLWRHLTTRMIYITGGIGPDRTNEGFTRDYDLPNDSTCAESCAAVGLIMWNQRMSQITSDSRYADLMELVLYNALLVGVSLDGQRYFYNNPLQSSGACHRENWYECACCPPNIARLLASLNTYIYSWRYPDLMVNLYIQSSGEICLATGEKIRFQQETNYPWDGRVRLKFESEQTAYFRLLLRIPGWCRFYQLSINNNEFKALLKKGYAVIERIWSAGDYVEFDMKMPIERIIANPAVCYDTGRIAIQRGPLVYCLEDIDQEVAVEQVLIPEDIVLTDRFIADFLGGVVVIEGIAFTQKDPNWEGVLYRPKTATEKYKVPIRAIPYYCWDNRNPGGMAVWLREI